MENGRRAEGHFREAEEMEGWRCLDRKVLPNNLAKSGL